MPRVSPTLEGFRAAFRRPLITFAEITWRWVVGATATVLFFFGLFEYLDTLRVTNAELLFLRTRQPLLVWQAITHILRGSLTRGVLTLLAAALLMALIWIFAASLGRIATVAAILEYFRARFALQDATPQSDEPDSSSQVSMQGRLAPLARLNFLRISTALAAIIGLVAAAVIAGFVSSPANPRVGIAFLLFVPIAGLVCLAWIGLNWLLSLAAVFAVRDGGNALNSLTSAVELCWQRTGAVFAVSSWTGLGHLAAFIIATTLVGLPLGLASVLPWRLIVLLTVLVTLIYFAVADWLYTARMAGYVCIAETPDGLLMPPPTPIPPSTPASAAIDKDELILSDVPNFA